MYPFVPLAVGVTNVEGEGRRRYGEAMSRDRRGGVAVTTRGRFRIAPSRSARRLWDDHA